MEKNEPNFSDIDSLERGQAMFAAIVGSSEDAIISKDLNSIVTSWNKAAEKMFGYTEQEMIGNPIVILIPADRHNEEEMIISQMKQGRSVEHYETIRLTKTGKEVYISLTVSPIKNSKGIIIGASKIARDITRQKQHEQRLQLINAMGKAIATELDINVILQNVTDTATKLSGAEFGAFFYNKTDSKGESYMLFTLSGAPREAFEKFGMPRNTDVFSHTFGGLGVVRSDDITKDPRYGKNAPHQGMPTGHLPVVSYLAVSVISKTGVVIGGLFFGHSKPYMFTSDHENLVATVSSQAAMALDNAMLYEEIHALNNKKDEFIGFASHELKTPLTTLKGYLQLAERGHISSTEYLPKINKQILRLEGIIADLLDISKIHAGKLDLNFKTISLLELLNESIDSVNDPRYKITLDSPANDFKVTVDVQKIMQVIINLLTNAIKFSEPGTTISITAVRIGDQVKISVSDAGVGIPQQHLDKIFNQFYRVSDITKTTKGMGLGLFISKEIIEGHLGKIWAESEEGKGSIFYIQFPIDRLKTNS